MTGQTGLKERLAAPGILVAPGVYDGLSALAAQQAGAEAVYLSGASIAYTRLGRPDVGLVTMSEVADILAAIHDRVTLPILADADNGYGNALNVQRTVRVFERAGASAIQLEDQAYPKRCGHLDGKSLISAGEMAGKVNAALDARENSQTLIIARTDAISVEGFEAALDRADAYRRAGADIVFVEGPESEQQLKHAVERLGSDVPLMANMVEGGKTPQLSAQALEKIGYRIVIFPGGLVRAQAFTARRYFESLLANGSNQPLSSEMVDFNGINEIVGTRDVLETGRRYDPIKAKDE